MEQIRFKTGEFQTFTATRSFALGHFGVRIEMGTELEFDGSVVKYAGAEYAFPQLRSAVTSGWIVLSTAYDADDPAYGRPATARIQVRSATQIDQPKMLATTVEADERIVLNTNEHADSTRAANRRTASQSGSDGVPVRTLTTPAVSVTTVTGAQQEISKLENLKITPGKGMTVDEMLERMPEREREQYLLKKEAARATYAQVSSEKSGSGRAVARVKNATTRSSAEGVTVTQTAGGGIETWDGGDAPVVAQIVQDKVSTVVEDGVTFTTTAPAMKAKKPAARATSRVSVDLRRKIAKALCPDFPDNYDFGASAKKKLARLQADFEDRSDVLLAVFAAEDDDEFKARLVQEFPQAFA